MHGLLPVINFQHRFRRHIPSHQFQKYITKFPNGLLRKIIAGQPLYAFGPEDALAQVTALQLGADDYLKTPILPILLEARLNAFHRLVPKEPARTNGIRAFSLDESTRTLRKGNASAQLRNKEYRLLKCLLHAPGSICTTDALLDDVWGINFDTGTNQLAVQVAALRKKLRHIGVPDAIETLRGVGYRLNPRLVGLGREESRLR